MEDKCGEGDYWNLNIYQLLCFRNFVSIPRVIDLCENSRTGLAPIDTFWLSFYPFLNLNTKLCLSYDRFAVGRKNQGKTLPKICQLWNLGLIWGMVVPWFLLPTATLSLCISSVLYKFCLCYLDRVGLMSVGAEARVAAECSHAPLQQPPAQPSQTQQPGVLCSSDNWIRWTIVQLRNKNTTNCPHFSKNPNRLFV